MDLFSTEYLLRVLLVFVRISALLVAAPVFGQKTIPVQLKVLLALLMAYMLAGYTTGPLPPHVTEMLGFVLALLVEAATGLVLGFAAQFIFFAIQFAGDVMGFQMGLSMAQVYNPATGTSSNPLGSILNYSFLLIFILLEGHHYVIQALALSFNVVPLAGANVAAGGPLFLEWAGRFFTTSLRLAAPFMITIFFIDVSLGVFARVMPQANLFILGLPLKLLSGLALFYFFMQNLLPVLPDFIAQMNDDLLRLLEALAG